MVPLNVCAGLPATASNSDVQTLPTPGHTGEEQLTGGEQSAPMPEDSVGAWQGDGET